MTDQVTCPRCRQPLAFVEGVVGPSRWRHTATDQVFCDPRCRHCGQPASIRVGHASVDGAGDPTFVLSHWECVTCAKRELRIEHV